MTTWQNTKTKEIKTALEKKIDEIAQKEDKRRTRKLWRKLTQKTAEKNTRKSKLSLKAEVKRVDEKPRC